MKIGKGLIGIIAAFFIAVGGDHYNIESRLLGGLYEKILPAKQGFPENYASIEIRYEYNNGMEIYLYDRDSKIRRPINPDLTAGTKSDMIKHIFSYSSFKNRKREGIIEYLSHIKRKLALYKCYLECKLKDCLK